MKKYRFRFVIFNMTFITVVLLVVLTAIGINAYRTAYSDLERTMQQVVAPFDEPNDKFQDVKDDFPPAPPEGETSEGAPVPKNENGESSTPPPKPPTEKTQFSKEKNITLVFVDNQTKEISVLTQSESLDSLTIADAVFFILGSQETFSTAKEFGVIYYKEVTETNTKIALAGTSYLNDEFSKTLLILVFAFLLSEGVLLLLSIFLSKMAAKPMETAIQRERQFVADISHDLKNPIAVILANNSILKKNTASLVAEELPWVESTDDAAKKMLKMVDKMLTLASLDEMNEEVKTSPVNLSSAAEKSVLQMESVAYEKGVELVSEISDEVTALATQEYAEKICSSLLENALKYEPTGGKVLFTLTTQKKKAVLTVKNFSSRISDEDLPHIFERFYRGDKARTGENGHGLGLPILKRMCELIGAKITCSNTDGTSFTVIFN